MATLPLSPPLSSPDPPSSQMQSPTPDLEQASKAAGLEDTVSAKSSSTPPAGFFANAASRLEALWGFEARGITRVDPADREPASAARDLQIALLWFSANVSANNLIVGIYGPTLFGLGFLDSAMCAVFGALLGSFSTAYMAIWGPRTGNRTSEF